MAFFSLCIHFHSIGNLKSNNNFLLLLFLISNNDYLTFLLFILIYEACGEGETEPQIPGYCFLKVSDEIFVILFISIKNGWFD